MVNELTGGGPRFGHGKKIDYAIEASLEKLQETFASDATFTFSLLEKSAKLTFKQAVDITQFLLLIEADSVFGEFVATHARAMLAGRVIATFKSLAGTKNMLVETTA